MAGEGSLRLAAGAVRDAVRNRDLARLLLSWAFSVGADWAAVVAVSVYAYNAAGAVGVGLIGLARALPSALAAPFMAIPGDRYRRERVLALVELARAACLAIAAIAAFAGWPVVSVYLAVTVASVVSSAYRSTQYALLPSVARSADELVAANVGLSSIEGFGTLVGPAVGGLLLAVTEPGTVFATCAAGFIVAALLLVPIHSRAVHLLAEDEHARGVVHEATEGFRMVATDPRPRLLIGLFAAQTLVRGALQVLLVVAAIELLKIGEPGVGYLSAAIGAGGLVGAGLTLVLVGRRRLGDLFSLGLVLWGIPIALIGVVPWPVSSLLMLAAVGIGNSVMDVAGMTLLQRTVPDRILTRVLGVLDAVVLACIGIGGVLVPPLIEGVGSRTALVLTGLVLPFLALLSRGGLRRIDQAVGAPTEGVDLLRSIAMFAPLDIPTLDKLARDLIPVVVGPDTIVIREGDVGDRFYAIERGSVRVEKGGREVAVLSVGDHFGEIALLRDVPRTASVIARENTRLLALERDDFLVAVTGHEVSRGTAQDIAGSRLRELDE